MLGDMPMSAPSDAPTARPVPHRDDRSRRQRADGSSGRIPAGGGSGSQRIASGSDRYDPDPFHPRAASPPGGQVQAAYAGGAPSLLPNRATRNNPLVVAAQEYNGSKVANAAGRARPSIPATWYSRSHPKTRAGGTPKSATPCGGSRSTSAARPSHKSSPTPGLSRLPNAVVNGPGNSFCEAMRRRSTRATFSPSRS
jgi:hypothetical protein